MLLLEESTLESVTDDSVLPGLETRSAPSVEEDTLESVTEETASTPSVEDVSAESVEVDSVLPLVELWSTSVEDSGTTGPVP